MLLDPYQFQPTKILCVARESAEAVSIQLETLAGYDFLPGQHAVVRVKVDGINYVRQYSFSSAPSSKEIWLTVVKTPGGTVSSWFVDDAKKGDLLEISKPYNGPLMQKSLRGQICMIAGGSGIAPLMSIVRENRLRDNPYAFSFLYSTRSGRRCFETELSPSAHEIINVKLSDIDGRLSKNEVTTAMHNCSDVFICGSREFVTTMKQLCQSISPNASIYAEFFTL